MDPRDINEATRKTRKTYYALFIGHRQWPGRRRSDADFVGLFPTIYDAESYVQRCVDETQWALVSRWCYPCFEDQSRVEWVEDGLNADGTPKRVRRYFPCQTQPAENGACNE